MQLLPQRVLDRCVLGLDACRGKTAREKRDEWRGKERDCLKTDVIRINAQGEGRETALAQVEAVSQFQGLRPKQALHLRLLGEEMMGLVTAITGEIEALFWMENEGGNYQLHLTVDTQMNAAKREELLAMSSDGKNMAARGVMGKLRELFVSGLYSMERMDQIQQEYMPSALGYGLGMEDPMTYSATKSISAWSLKRYRERVEELHSEDMDNQEVEEAWDELEKSVVGKLADEVRIGIQGGQVEMVIYKAF